MYGSIPAQISRNYKKKSNFGGRLFRFSAIEER